MQKKKQKRPAPKRSGFSRLMEQRPRPVWMVVVFDILAIGVALIVFALFHHVIPRELTPVAAPPTSVEAEVVEYVEAETGNDAVEQAEFAVQAAIGDFSNKFADKFTDGAIEKTADSYRSPNLNISFTHGSNGFSYHIADIYIRDIGCLKTALSKDTYGKSVTQPILTVAENKNAVLMINGDYYGARSEGPVLRNGTVYREDLLNSMDVCVLYEDGSMETFSPHEFEIWREKRSGALQAWGFGPMLLDREGQPMEKFNSSVNPANPRTVIGYYEPGHYCFITVDGRSETSSGVKLITLSRLMNEIGCKRAFNLDGGRTSIMVYDGQIINEPYKGGRYSSDYVYLTEDCTRVEGTT